MRVNGKKRPGFIVQGASDYMLLLLKPRDQPIRASTTAQAGAGAMARHSRLRQANPTTAPPPQTRPTSPPLTPPHPQYPLPPPSLSPLRHGAADILRRLAARVNSRLRRRIRSSHHPAQRRLHRQRHHIPIQHPALQDRNPRRSGTASRRARTA